MVHAGTTIEIFVWGEAWMRIQLEAGPGMEAVNIVAAFLEDRG